MASNVPRLHGPGVVDREGRLAKWLVDFLESLAGGVSTATTTAEAAAATAASVTATPPTTIAGPGITGSAETGYTFTPSESALTLGKALELPNLVNFY